MGASPNAADYYSRPDPAMQIAQLQMQRSIGQQQLENQDRLLGYAANLPMETWTPDIWGQDGLAAQSAQIAAINQFKNKQLEERTNPELAKLRAELPGKMQESLSDNSWEKQMQEWAKTAGLYQYLGSGLGDSTIGRSALFDAATREGAAIQQEKLQQAAAYLAANPMVDAGINAGSAIGAQQAAQIQGMQQRAGFRDTMLGRTQGAAQSTTDWLNQMMASANQAVESNKRDWQNYQQAMYKGAADKAANRNALIAAGISAGGAALGGALAGAGGAAGGAMSEPPMYGIDPGGPIYTPPTYYQIY